MEVFDSSAQGACYVNLRIFRWVKAANQQRGTLDYVLTNAEDLETDWMEKKSVELADIAWTPSADIVEWLGNQGWTLPESLFLMPYLPGREISQVLNTKVYLVLAPIYSISIN